MDTRARRLSGIVVSVALLALLSAPGPSGGSTLQGQEPRRPPPDRRLVRAPPAGARAEAAAGFLQRYGGDLLWNVATGRPARIRQLRVPMAPALTAPRVRDALLDFLDENRSLLGVDPSRLQERSSLERRGRIFLRYQQVHEGVPVEGATVGVVASIDGRILSYDSSFVEGIAAPVAARVAPSRAEQIARAALGASGRSARIRSLEKVIRPESAGGEVSYRLVYRLHLRTRDRTRNPHRLVEVDAQTGEVLADHDATPATISGTVRGEVFPDRHTDPTQTVALEHVSVVGVPLQFGFPAGTSTAANGGYTLPTGSGAYSVAASLTGSFAGVASVSQTDVAHAGVAMNGQTHSWDWTQANGQDLDQVNVFYHINRLHDELYADVLGYQWTNSWTGNARFLAETGYSFANAYAGSPMTFGGGSWSREADGIYHECSHNVIYTLFGGAWVGYGGSHAQRHSEAYAFDEGFADYFAAALLGRSGVIGRNLQNTMLYPPNYDVSTGQGLEGHTGGQIIAGAAWDLRLLMQAKLGATLGARESANLVFDALSTMATYSRPYRFSAPGTSNFLDALLETDDTNGNLADGTPNDREILQAFRNHDLLPVDLCVRDRLGDSGDVPSNAGGQYSWLSPDIVWPSSSQIQVRVRNLGYATSGSASVDVYSADVTKGLKWPGDWTKVGTATVTAIPPNGQKLTNAIPCLPGTSKWGNAFRARVRSSEDPITEPGNVVLDNNIAQRNHIVKLAYAGKPFVVHSILDWPIWKGPLEPASASPGARGAHDARDARARRVARPVTFELIREDLPEDIAVEFDLLDAAGKRVLPHPEKPERRRVALPADREPRLREEAPDLARRMAEMRERNVRLARARAERARLGRSTAAAAATPSPAATRAVVDTCVAESYRDLRWTPAERATARITFRVPERARSGEVYSFHLVELHGDRVASAVKVQVAIGR